MARQLTPEQRAEIDAAVAEKVMGWRVHNRNTAWWVDANEETGLIKKGVKGLCCGVNRWSPSTDIAAAMEALDEVVGACFYSIDNGWRLDDKGERLPAGHTCTITLHDRTGEATASTRELAISLACLKAVGVDTKEWEG